MKLTIIEEQQKLKAAPKYTPMKVGREWKVKTAHFLITRGTKQQAAIVAEAYRNVDGKVEELS